MELVGLIREFEERFEEKYAGSIGAEHRQAIRAIVRCRTPAAGQLVVRCPDCARTVLLSHSCGHRSCPRCQNHETGAWIDRQRQKLLPVPYFLVTFTVPAALRPLARARPRLFFDALFDASAGALRKLAADERFLGGDPGMTGVLHTHSRRLDFHPHVHYLIPGGAIDQRHRLWKRKDWKFLFPQAALAKIFRAKLLDRLIQEGCRLPAGLVAKKKWVVNCKPAGSGEPALKYLARYLYRGVIDERRIGESRDGAVTFVYRESSSKSWNRRTLPGADFLRLVLQHVLPRGFRRTRDFGFLHGNARKALRLIQYLLQAKAPPRAARPRPAIKCPDCHAEMAIVAIGLKPVSLATGPP